MRLQGEIPVMGAERGRSSVLLCELGHNETTQHTATQEDSPHQDSNSPSFSSGTFQPLNHKQYKVEVTAATWLEQSELRQISGDGIRTESMEVVVGGIQVHRHTGTHVHSGIQALS